MNQALPDKAVEKLEKAENIIGHLLFWGVQICGAVIALGWLGCLLTDRLLNFNEFTHSDAHQPIFLQSVFDGVLKLDPKAVLYFGLLLLIALPILRVGTTIFVFVIQKDKYFIFFSSVVFAILLFSLLAGKSL